MECGTSTWKLKCQNACVFATIPAPCKRANILNASKECFVESVTRAITSYTNLLKLLWSWLSFSLGFSLLFAQSMHLRFRRRAAWWCELRRHYKWQCSRMVTRRRTLRLAVHLKVPVLPWVWSPDTVAKSKLGFPNIWTGGYVVSFLTFWLTRFRGECNSCVLTVGGTRMKPCVDKVPPEPKLKSLQENGLAIR